MADLDARGRIIAVVPAYNEGAVIQSVVAGLRRSGIDVVVVDDGSRDDTADVARGAGAVVLRHVVNRGQGAALQTGIEYAVRAGADFVVTFDADGQHRVEDIARMVAALERENADVAIGSRFLNEASSIPAARRLLLRAAVFFTRIVSGVSLSDAHNGLRVFRRHAAAQIRITLDGMAHASELIDQLYARGMKVIEVPVVIHYTDYSLRKGQSSSAAFRIAFDYLIKRLFR